MLPLLSQALHLQFIHSLAPAAWDGEEMSVLQAAFEDAALKLHRKKSVFFMASQASPMNLGWGQGEVFEAS